MKTKIINYLRAGYPGLYLLSSEEQRVEAEMKAVAQELQCKLVSWSAVAGKNMLAQTPILEHQEEGAVRGQLGRNEFWWHRRMLEPQWL